MILDGSASAGQAFNFTGTVSGFAGQNAIDLPGIAFDAETTLGYSPNSNTTGGTLSLTDSTHDASIALLGSYMASSFVMESDHHGGTMVLADATQSGNQAGAGQSSACVSAELTAPPIALYFFTSSMYRGQVETCPVSSRHVSPSTAIEDSIVITAYFSGSAENSAVDSLGRRHRLGRPPFRMREEMQPIVPSRMT